ncbi:MAG: anti-sigma regulatory factor [Coleofasciculaceae cyanobacterium]
MKTELQIPSESKFLNVVESWLRVSLQVELGDSLEQQQQFNRLRLVLVEAFSNVVRHAHQNRPNLPILICLEVIDEKIALEIWDYGEGFDIETYLPPNPTSMQISGYGWLIIKQLMDRVEYKLQDTRDGRNCLRLESRLSQTEKAQ